MIKQFNINKIKKILFYIFKKFKKSIRIIDNDKLLNNLKNKYIGKNSLISYIIKNINFYKNKNKNIPYIGKIINLIKTKILNIILKKKKIFNNKKYNILFEFDTSIPCINNKKNLHPITYEIFNIIEIFRKMNFIYLECNEIENIYNNFDLLNININHPSRSLKDTLWINKKYLLRTHTTNIQKKILNIKNFPINLISCGKVYRKDNDSTHYFMFHQIEGLCINKNINIANLKFILNNFLYNFFNNKNIKIKYRISYFPFTEPSIEIDILKNNKYIEILGAGVIKYNILKKLNVDYKIYNGLAFGIGLERLLMIKYNIKDIKDFFINDMKFLNQFKFI